MITIEYDRMNLDTLLLVDTKNEIATVYNIKPSPRFTALDGGVDATHLYKWALSIASEPFDEERFFAHLRELRAREGVHLRDVLREWLQAYPLEVTKDMLVWALDTFPSEEEYERVGAEKE